MRKLMLLTIGFGGASLFCVYRWQMTGLIAPLFIFAVLGILLLFLREKRILRAIGIVLLGAALGFGWFSAYCQTYLSKALAMDGLIGDVTARCTDYSYDTGYGTGVDGILYLDGRPYRTRFYVSGQIEMEPGDVLRGAFRFQLTTPESEFDSTSYQGKGIFLRAWQEEDAELLKPVSPPRWAYPAIFRQRIMQLLEDFLPEDTAFFGKALLLGHRWDFDYETSTAFQVSGISHIIAVSGLHVTILYTLVLNLCMRRRWLVALLGIPVLCFFAMMAGFSPSVIRACIMQGLMILATLLNRDYDGPTELSFACLVMILVNPLIVVSVSFQLSVGCIIGIFLFQKRIAQWILGCFTPNCPKAIQWLQRSFASSVAMTVSAISLTTPLVAYYFGTVSLVGIVTNLLTLPVVSIVFYGLMLVSVVGFCSAGAAAILGKIVSVPIRYILLLSRSLGRFPLAAVYTQSVYIVIWLVLCYLMLALFLLLRRKSPALLTGCMALSLCLCIGISWVEPLVDDCRVTVLDVGQGQCILLQSEGKTYMVDCGGDNDQQAADLAARKLLSQGISRLDGLILTHYDRDHAGGTAYLLTRISADLIFLPDFEDTSGVRQYLESMYPDRIIHVGQDLLLQYGSTQMTIFGPIVSDFDNESSMAVLFRGGNCDILITGDRSDFGERILLKAGLPDLEVLIAGHHGSKTSTCEELLAATMPEIVAISVGENNYGHPVREVLDRLAQFGCNVYRTDLDGNIIIRR